MCLIDEIQTQYPRRTPLLLTGVGYKVLELTEKGELLSCIAADSAWTVGEFKEARNLGGSNTRNPTVSFIPDPWGFYIYVKQEDAEKVANAIPGRPRAAPTSRYVACELEYVDAVLEGMSWGFGGEQLRTIVARKARILRVL